MIPCLICLGRYGDILNALPIAKHMADEAGAPVKFVVARQFESLLKAMSYVTPIIARHPDYGEGLKGEMQRFPDAVVAQWHCHPTDQKKITGSFQTEIYRIAGYADLFYKMPLVLDNRNAAREEALAKRFLTGRERPILFAGNSYSSTFTPARVLYRVLVHKYGKRVIDMAHVRAYSPEDLLGLFERAACLVTVDTMHFHLARVTPKLPVVALLNDGWYGSVPYAPNVVEHFQYSKVVATSKPWVDNFVAQVERAAS
jgi:hypothetical protein